MDFNQFLSLIPGPVIVVVFGLSWGAKSYFEKKGKDVPAWFLAIPSGAGLIGGVMYYFVIHDTAALATLTFWRRVTESAWNGVVCAAVAVFMWEIYKKTLGAWLDSKKPDPPPPTDPPKP